MRLGKAIETLFRSATTTLLLAAAGAGAVFAADGIEELPVAFRCSGDDPSWSLTIEGPRAAYASAGGGPQALSGTFRTLDYAGLFVFRGAPAAGEEWVAMVLHRSCESSMAVAEGKGERMPFAIGLSLPGGDVRLGCCQPLEVGHPLAGTSWRLVEIQSMDDAIGTARPDDPALYTLRLNADGTANLRLNCNRGSGSWSARPGAEPTSGGFELGRLAVTRALCPAPSLDERIAAQAAYIRSFLVKEDRLFLSLEADGGILVWERASE